MSFPILRIVALLGSAWPALVMAAPPSVVHHALQVELSPADGTIRVIDRLEPPAVRASGARIAPSTGTLEFAVGSRLQPMKLAGVDCVSPTPLPDATPRAGVQRYRVARNNAPITLCFGGRIDASGGATTDPLRGGHEGSDAMLRTDAAYLGPASGWYPRLGGDTLETFSLDVGLPDGWHAISQGEGVSRDASGRAHWRETHPQPGIHLVAGPFKVWREGRAEVYLRDDDAALARRYLRATRDYLTLYERYLGPYPYAKFALLENVHQSGWGMPSFTLLGGRVLRLPFITHTSYPHEILHNWWGNGVYVDYADGNWSEGLTTYLADHALAERRGRGQAKRRDALTAFARYDGDGVPLRAFLGRHDRASQALGYGKSFLFFHMLRRQLGDETFLTALRDFFTEHRFQRAGYAALRAAFERASGEALGDVFRAWIDRPDSPRLTLHGVSVRRTADGHEVRGTLRQSQPGAPFPLRVPVAISTQTGVREFLLDAGDRETPFAWPLDSAPTRLDVDPRNDLFRLLDPAEVPPSLGDAMHARRIALVLPHAAEPALRAAYQGFAEAWRGPGVRVVWDTDFVQAEPGEATWYLGRDNRHRCELDNALEAADLPLPEHARGDSVALALPVDSPDDAPRAWLFTDNPQALPGLARKLPHYGRYAWLRFTGDAPDNVAKGDWPVTHSPLTRVFQPGAELHPPPLPALLGALDDTPP